MLVEFVPSDGRPALADGREQSEIFLLSLAKVLPGEGMVVEVIRGLVLGGRVRREGGWSVSDPGVVGRL